MAYPVLRTTPGATLTPTTGRVTDRATNGAVRGRVLYPSPKAVFRFTHDTLQSADFATFKAFYAANLANSFAYVYPGDGVSYNCIFGADPVYTSVDGLNTTVSVELLQA